MSGDGATPPPLTVREATPPDPVPVPVPAGVKRLGATTLGVIGMAMFAGTLPATRLALAGFGPGFITAGRAVIAGVLAAALLYALRVPRPKGADLIRLGAVALCLVIGFPLFSGLAMERVGASHGSVVLAIMPVATAIAATLVGGERPGRMFWLLSVAGAVVVFGFMALESEAALAPQDLYLLAAAVSASLGYALSGTLARGVPGWTVIAWALIFSLPFTAVATLATWPSVWPTAPTVWAGFLYLGGVSMFLGFVFWNSAMALGGIARIAQIQLLQPFVTIAIAAVVTVEPVLPRHVVFAALVVLVVAAAQRTRVSSPRDVR